MEFLLFFSSFSTLAGPQRIIHNKWAQILKEKMRGPGDHPIWEGGGDGGGGGDRQTRGSL